MSVNVLVLGGYGNVGKAIVTKLIQHKDISQVGIAGRNRQKLKALVDSLNQSKCSLHVIDFAGEARRLTQLLTGFGIVINAMSHEYNLSIMKACLETGTNYLDLGGMFHITQKQLNLNERFSAAGLTAVLCMGACPGISNVLAAYGAKQFDQVEEFHIRVGSLRPEETRGFNMSIRTLLDEFTKNAVVFENGGHVEVPPLSGRDRFVLPAPVGEVEGFYALHSEVLTLPASFPGVKKVTYRVSFPPVQMRQMEVLLELGFGSTQTISIKGAEISPREFLTIMLENARTQQPFIDEYKALQVETRGRTNGKPGSYSCHTVVGSNRALQMNASAIWTSIPASIAVTMIARQEINKKGVFPPERAVDPSRFIEELEKEGIQIHKDHKVGDT
ncbi:MAG: saccharopine dehydrogenase family protein [Thermodesulfobacteriota bacterium]